MDYLLHIFITINIYAVLAIGLNLIGGYAGLLSLCQAGFFGIGAYCTALLMVKANCPWGLSLMLSVVVCGIIAFSVGASSSRLRSDYFVIMTFAFQLVLFNVIHNWTSLTDGPMGITNIPKPVLWGWHVDSNYKFALFSFLLTIILFIAIKKVVHSPYGRILRAIREDEIFTQSLGKNIYSYKILTFILGSVLAGIAGSIYAPYVSYIDPSGFSVSESIFILCIVIIGGAGNIWGSIIGAAFLVILPEALRFIGMPTATAAIMRQIIYGALLVVCMLYRPQGLLGEYSFNK